MSRNISLDIWDFVCAEGGSKDIPRYAVKCNPRGENETNMVTSLVNSFPSVKLNHNVIIIRL